jgi:putative transposase
VQEDSHLLTVLRYVEANPLRAGLANRAGEWPWSAEALRGGAFSSLLSDWPIPRPADWRQWIESRWKSDERDEIRANDAAAWKGAALNAYRVADEMIQVSGHAGTR